MKSLWNHCRGWCTKHSGQLVLRVVLGLFFFAHGLLKFQDMDNTIAFFASLGFPSFLAYLVAGIEVVGGIALVLGIFTCTFGVLLAVIQLVAVFKVTARIPAPSALIGFAMGYGMNLVLAAAALGVGFTGPGRMSLWRGKCCLWCRRDKDCADCESCRDCMKCEPGGKPVAMHEDHGNEHQREM